MVSRVGERIAAMLWRKGYSQGYSDGLSGLTSALDLIDQIHGRARGDATVTELHVRPVERRCSEG